MEICHFQDHAVRAAVIPIVEFVRQDGKIFPLRLLWCLLVGIIAEMIRSIMWKTLAATNDSSVARLFKLGSR